MTDRDTMLQWLIQQAKDHDRDGVFALHTPEVTKAKTEECVRNGEAVLSEDLVWDLASGAVTMWFEPELPELKELNGLEKVNLLRLAVELAIKADLKNTIWLELSVFNFCSSAVNPGLGLYYLPELIERFNSCASPGIPLENIHDTLDCLDSMAHSVDEPHREISLVIAVSLATSFSAYMGHSPATAGLPGSSVSANRALADWVMLRAQDILQMKTIPDVYRFEAYRCVCSSLESLSSEKLLMGQIAVSDLLSWFENQTSKIEAPTIQDSRLEVPPRVVAQRIAYTLIELGAEWLVNNGDPSSALKFLTSESKRYPDVSESDVGTTGVALIRASAYASLGRVQRAIKEIIDIPLDLSGTVVWATGRLWCETWDERGLCWLRKAVALPRELGYQPARARMALLLAEKEIENGSPMNALHALSNLRHVEDRWIFFLTRIVAAEALLAIGRENLDERERYLKYASEVLAELVPGDILDTPDRILPRALAALGEIAILRSDFRSARSLLRRAMEELEKEPPLAWNDPDTKRSTYVSPTNTPDQYWLRPWSRNWTRTAELCLMAELEDKLHPESAFDQLQIYRTVIHTGTIAELAGFNPEASLGGRQRKLLGELRDDGALLEARIKSLGEEVRKIDEALGNAAQPTSEFQKLRRRRKELSGKLKEKTGSYQTNKEKILQIKRLADETRGFLASANRIVRPKMDEVRRILAEEDAAVVELVRVDGAQWGQPIRWFAFAVTSDVGVTHVELPAKEIDRELARLRSDRTRMRKDALGKLSDLIVGKLPKQLFLYKNLFIAADGDAWAIPFRSLVRRRWWFVPWKLTDSSTYNGWPIPEAVKKFMDSLATRMDNGVVSNIISTSHLLGLFRRSRQREEHEDTGVVVGSSGGSGERILCEGLATSLATRPPEGVAETQWKRYPGSLQACTPAGGDRPEWLNGTSQVFMGSWHTTFSGDPTTVATFHFDDGEMSLAEFLSQSRHKSNIAVILSCNISLPTDEYTHASTGDNRVFSRIGSAGFGIIEALRSEAMVATTNEVTAEVAFVLGRFLTAELATGADVHTALAASQRRLRECTIEDITKMLKGLEPYVPETEGWLKTLNSKNPKERAFPDAYDTEPFYILGLPTAKLGSAG